MCLLLKCVNFNTYSITQEETGLLYLYVFKLRDNFTVDKTKHKQ